MFCIGREKDMLREITPEETGILYECMEDLGRHHNDVSVYFKGIYPTISSEEIVRQFAAEMEAGNSYIAVIEEGERVIGLCKISITKETGVLEYLVVLNEEKGKGHGSELMDWAFRKFNENNVKNIEVKVVYGNDAAEFYKRFGFREKSIILCLKR